MVDNLDELVLLLLRTSGMNDAVATFGEETGVPHAEAVIAVRKLARGNTSGHGNGAVRKIKVALTTAKTIGEG